MTIEELQFGGKVVSVVEDELKACLRGEYGNHLVADLYASYCLDGKPKNVKAWLRPRLENLFLCIEKQPDWVEGNPEWPYFNEFPMTFVGQTEAFNGERMLYIFHAKRPHPDIANGYSNHYEIVEQMRGSKGLVALVSDLDDISQAKIVAKRNRK